MVVVQQTVVVVVVVVVVTQLRVQRPPGLYQHPRVVDQCLTQLVSLR
jgi:hypothetical protein